VERRRWVGRPLSTAPSLSVAPAAGQKFKQWLGRNLDLAAEPQHWGWPLAVVHEPVGGGAAESEQCGGPDEVEHAGSDASRSGVMAAVMSLAP
jgi:hypothetical protein